MTRPAVSVLIPTRDRRAWLPHCLAAIAKQTYDPARIEIVVADDGREPVADLCPSSVRYVRLGALTPLGTKRNLLCEAASGEILIHFDDDDWQAPTRIADAVAALTQAEPEVVGRSDVAVWDLAANTTHITPSAGKRHALAGTLAYRRSHWRAHPFSSEATNEERAFLRNFDVPLTVLNGAPEHTLVAIVHGENARLRTHAYPQANVPIEAWLPADAITAFRAIERDAW